MNDDLRLLRPREAAELLGVSVRTVYRLIDAGLLPSVRLGGSVRIPVAAIERLVRETLGEPVASGGAR